MYFDSVSLVDDTKHAIIDNLKIALSALSDKNRREYLNTFRMWQIYSNNHDNFAMNFRLMLVFTFLTHNNWSHNTRKVRLSHLRKFAEILGTSDENNECGFAYNFGRLKLLKPKSLGGKKSVAKTRALSNKQVYLLFDAISGTSNADTRNRAILGLMLLSGLRSSEIVAMQWLHVDFGNDTIFVSHGKGDKSAHIPMLGDLKQLLATWKTRQSIYGEYSYICTQIFRSDALGQDALVHSRLISNLVKKLNKLTGIEFNPHDTRRTAISVLLNNGASVVQTQNFARHSSGETTLRYAQKYTARQLGNELNSKLKYGDVLGAVSNTNDAIYFECAAGHGFSAVEPLKCPICDDTNLSQQINMFSD